MILPAFPAYDIFAPDLINVYIPPEAVYSNQMIVSSTQVSYWPSRAAHLVKLAVP